jgi:integrase
VRALRFGDYVDGHIVIRRVVIKLSSPYRLECIDATKSDAGQREIPLSSTCRELLEDMRRPSILEAEFAEDGATAIVQRAGRDTDPFALLWPTQRKPRKGEPIDQSRLSKALEKLRQTALIPELACREGHFAPIDKGSCVECLREALPLRVHDLRHTHCSQLLAAGVPRPAILYLMGWSSPTMLNRYGHVTIEGKEAALNALENIPSITNQAKWRGELEPDDIPF